MEDALTDIKKTEATIRKMEADVKSEFADLRQKAVTAQKADVDAYAEALAAGAPVPKATASKIKERMRDIEMRVLPSADESLWLLVPKVREAVKPDVKEQFLTQNLKRWQAPDPHRRDQPSPTQHLAHRPMSVVDWVLSRIAAVKVSEAEQQEKDDREARKRAATERVNQAQSAYNAEQSILLHEKQERMSPTARNAAIIAQNKSQSPPWPDFDRRAFLEREGLLEAYGWVMGGGSIEVKGGNGQEVEFVPKEALMPASTQA
jgi:hypothetical protein